MMQYPEDEMYRGIEIPKRLKRYWNNTSGNYWRQGVDAVLDRFEYKQMEENAWRYEQVMK